MHFTNGVWWVMFVFGLSWSVACILAELIARNKDE
jgi:hypothetical protein